MDKRYQVFISSTLEDLKPARQEVSQALLRADCFPAGMELFPATDEEQFEYIKTVIDQSDYYIIISAGRYGSTHPVTGLSYTEMEYDYALDTGKPIIRLLHKDPFNELKGEYIEKSEIGREALSKFRDKMSKSSLVKFWSNPEQLKAETVFALQDIQLRKPAIGWVRADGRATEDAELEIAKLRQELAELKLESIQHGIPDFDEKVGQDNSEFDYYVEELNDDFKRGPTGTTSRIKLSMTEIKKLIVISALSSVSSYNFRWDIESHVASAAGFKKYQVTHPKDLDFEQILNQFEADLVFYSEVVDSGISGVTNRIWSLTEEARPWAAGLAARRLKTPPPSAL